MFVNTKAIILLEIFFEIMLWFLVIAKNVIVADDFLNQGLSGM